MACAVPTTFACLMASRSPAGMPTSYTAAPWIAASEPSMAERSFSRSERSPWTRVTPGASSSPAFDGSRTSATTSSPRSVSLRTT